MKLKTYSLRLLGDLSTPVGMYLRIRERFTGSCLLESSDYRGIENSRSFIGVEPIAKISVKEGDVVKEILDRNPERFTLESKKDLANILQGFVDQFKVSREFLENEEFQGNSEGKTDIKEHDELSPFNGVLGYLTYDAVQYFEDINFTAEREEERDIPDASYTLFRYLIEVHHFKSQLYISRNVLEDEEDLSREEVYKSLSELSHILFHTDPPESHFKPVGEQSSNFTDEEHIDVVNKCLKHIQRGDIFQIVPSRRFQQAYQGDDFQVYRVLRAINPSPYLFYYDCGGFRLFGSSPEALLTVRDGVASSYPIAGTCPRTGDDVIDRERSKKLLQDPKENSEHVMLVDLARNDLSRFCKNVKVKSFREVQNYSHVIHLVSRVDGEINKEVSPFSLLQATLPAGTLSGAPKYRAMELIDVFERGHRSYYAGAIGTVSFSGELNHAIMIRSFLSKDNVLYSQAGGGVVAESSPQAEMEEVKSKLGALRSAIEKASTLFSEVKRSDSESVKVLGEVEIETERSA